ncbi:hypothetical protein [Bacillus timonensis]|nr:hypothetical protein [Bacillus timonensis]
MSKNKNDSQNKITYSIWDTNTEKNHTILTSKSSETAKKKRKMEE